MKRTNSRGLDDVFVVKRSTGPVGIKTQQPAAGHKSSAGRGYGLASKPSSSQLTGGGSGGGAAAAAGGLPEVCSPPAKSLNFLTTADMPFSSPFAAAAQRRQQRQQRPACSGGSGLSSSSSSDDEWDAEEAEDRENRKPCSALPAAAPAAATWLVSPVSRGRRPAPASEPLAIPSPSPATALLLSPGGLPTPAKEGPLSEAPTSLGGSGGTGTLHHAPSFSSWMVSAAMRPPSPEAPPQQRPCAVNVADVVAGLVPGAATAPRAFEQGRPSHLDMLLAELGDSHYPASVLQWEQEELPDSDTERA